MIKTFDNLAEAESDLKAHGFTLRSDKVWEDSDCEAMVHPITGTQKVRVSYVLTETTAL